MTSTRQDLQSIAADRATLGDVTVVYVTYESEALVDGLAHAINRAERVIVVDNGSTDATVKKIRESCRRAELMENPENLGFGVANNLALAKVTTRFALLVNPDCTYTDSALVLLLETADRYPSAALIAPQAMGPAGPQVSYRGSYFEKLASQPYLIPDGVTSCQFLSGCFLLLRIDAFEGRFFDPRFFLYFEDDDICLRARALGYECLLEPLATVFHHLGKTSQHKLRTSYIKAYHYARSKRLLTFKHQGRGDDLLIRLNYLLVSPWMIVLFIVLLQKEKMIKWLGRFIAGFSAFETESSSDD